MGGQKERQQTKMPGKMTLSCRGSRISLICAQAARQSQRRLRGTFVRRRSQCPHRRHRRHSSNVPSPATTCLSVHTRTCVRGGEPSVTEEQSNQRGAVVSRRTSRTRSVTTRITRSVLHPNQRRLCRSSNESNEAVLTGRAKRSAASSCTRSEWQVHQRLD